jgi:hypothetical protein
LVQGSGKMNNLRLDCPKLIRFGEMTDDEVFCSEVAARSGVVFENTGETEDLVVLRYLVPKLTLMLQKLAPIGVSNRRPTLPVGPNGAESLRNVALCFMWAHAGCNSGAMLDKKR